MNPKDIKTYTAGGEVKPYQIVKITDRGKVEAASATSQTLIGVAIELGAKKDERVDIAHGGLPKVKLSAAVTVGAALTTDTDGYAKAASSGDMVVGFALSAGADGDVIPFVFSLHKW